MENQFIIFFSTLDQRPILRLAILVGGLIFFWVIEGMIPLLPMHYKRSKAKHASVNFIFTLAHLIIHTFLALGIIQLSDWCRSNQFGLVYWIQAEIVLTLIATFLVLDFFGGWLVHVVEHNVSWLWRFHLIHHSDNSVDVSTGLRHHPVESVVRGVFFFIGIALSGAPMYAIMFFQTVLVLATAFTHANIHLPIMLDKIVSYFLISPNMHKVHHHWKQPYTDSNYGAILSIWDRLLGTYLHLPIPEIKYGLDRYYPNERDEDVLLLIQHPFQKK